MRIDPITRYLHIGYDVPPTAPAEVHVFCHWSPPGRNEWTPAKVTPLISETGRRLLPAADWRAWTTEGKVTERRAAGLVRTLVFNPYPEAQVNGKLDVDFRLQIYAAGGAVLSTQQLRLQADNSDVVCLRDWSRVVQTDALAPTPDATERKWGYRRPQDPSSVPAGANVLIGQSPPDVPLRALTYPLDLRGWFALFVCTVPEKGGGIRLRLTGDERSDPLHSPHPGEEVLWRWCRLDRQHLVVHQSHIYTGYAAASLDYVRLVPLDATLVQALNGFFDAPGETRDKLVAGYFEPYSWAFVSDVRDTLQHREPLTAFVEAQVDRVDLQIGRFGCKSVFETRLGTQLLGTTYGDPIGKVERPTTDNVGRMQQYTNTLDAELRYARELGLTAFANFGATNCYPNSPLQAEFSKQHPEWMRGSTLRYEVPEVRAHMLALWREALEIGAPGLALDFCRYPGGIDKPDTCTAFLRELRQLADEFGRQRGGGRVPISVRFPGTDVHGWQNFDYATWCRERLVDFLCPGNIQGRHHHLDVAPYIAAARGTGCKVLPVVDGLGWGLEMPGPFLWRVRQVYEAGADGVYVYQADGRVLGTPSERRCMRLLGNPAALRRWWQRDAEMRPQCAKGIFITHYLQEPGYHGWERLRAWLDGVPLGAVEFLLDGKLVNRCEGPPYLLGSEQYNSDGVIPPGEHKLTVRAQDGDGWLEQAFTLNGAP